MLTCLSVHITTVSEDGGPTCASKTEHTRPNRWRSIGSRMSRAWSYIRPGGRHANAGGRAWATPAARPTRAVIHTEPEAQGSGIPWAEQREQDVEYDITPARAARGLMKGAVHGQPANRRRRIPYQLWLPTEE